MRHKSVRVFDSEAMSTLLKGLKVASYSLIDYERNEQIIDIQELKLDNLTISDSLSCSFCKTEFENQVQQRSHYKLDWHRFNLKQQLNRLSSVTESEYDKIIDETSTNTNKSNASSSESENDSSDTADEETTTSRLYGKVIFENDAHNILSFNRCMLYNKKDVPSLERDLITLVNLSSQNSKIMIIILGGGHFASTIFDKENIVVHRTLHYYTVRSKQGGSQSSRDNRSSGNHPKSAGATLRRHNESLLFQHVKDTLDSWKDEISTVDVIFYRAPGPVNHEILFGGKNPALNKSDTRLRHISISTRKATHRESIRVHTILTTVDVYNHKEDFENELKKKTQASPKNKRINRSKSREVKDRSIINESFDELVPNNSSISDNECYDDGLVLEEYEVDLVERLQWFSNKEKNNNRFEAIKSPQDDDTTTNSSVKSSRVASPLLDNSEKRKYTQLKSRLIHGCRTGNLDMLNNSLSRAKKQLQETTNENLDAGDLLRVMSESVTKNGDTLLHMAASEGRVGIVEWLMDNDANPCQRNRNNLTPYAISADKNVRSAFRSFANRNPDKFDYVKAQIPLMNLSETEILQRKRESRKLKRNKKVAKLKEDSEVKCFQALSEREKRALAAEKRMMNTAKSIRCFTCGKEIQLKHSFEYSDNLFCSVECLKNHRQKFGLILSI